MAAETRDSSGTNTGSSGSGHGTPMSSYVGLAIITAIALAVVVLQGMAGP